MINKKSIALGMIALATLGLAACGGNTTSSATEVVSTANLNIWCPTSDNAMMATIIKDFKAANPKATGEIKVSANFGEGDVATNLTKDVTAAADVMCIADDNIRAAVKARALTGLTADDKTAITASDGATAVSVGSISDTLYGYPYRADNSYVLMYNKTLFTADQVGSLDTLLAAAKDKKTSVYFDLANGWYGASYLWANGCTQNVDTDGKFQCTFDSDAGVAAATAMQTLYKTYGGSQLVFSSDTGLIDAGFKDKSVGACILWNHVADLQTAIGADNLGVVKLPTMKIGGADKQLGAFVGYKFMAIKKNPSDAALAKAFAAFASSKTYQKARALDKTLGYGPSNQELSSDAEIQALPFLSALSAQVKTGVVVAQGPSTVDNFWTPMASFNTIIKENAAAGTWGDYADAKAALTAMVEQMKA